jgi:YVTN family beta-propeller protein
VRNVKAVLIASVMLVLLSCGDPSGPSPEPGPTPSVLSAEFLGWVPPGGGLRGVPWVVEVTWTACPDSGFVSYMLYRSVYPGVSTNPDATRLVTYTDRDSTTFTDTSGLWDRSYHYAVRTFNSEGSSWSNEDTVTIGPETSYGGPDTHYLEVQVGGGPSGICAVYPSGESFVSCYFDNSVYVLGTAAEFFAVQDVIPVGSGPMDICTSGSYAFVTNSQDNTVSVIDVTTRTVVETVGVGEHPVGLCPDPARGLVLVACYDSDELWIIDASSFTAEGSIPVGNGPWDVCVSGSCAYIANRLDGTVSVVDLNTMSVVATLNTGSETRNVCALTDGSEVWASDYSGQTVYVIDAATNSVERSFTTGNGPACVYPLGNGQIVYLSCIQDSKVDMLDPVTGLALYSLVGATRAEAYTESPDGSYLLLCDSATGSVAVYEYDPYP